jgi:hypothetical protein
MQSASDRRIEANRRNATRSTGPKTAQGKARASRNARKHGLSIAVGSEASGELLTLARMMCGEQRDSLLNEQAIIIAECQLLLGRIRRARASILDEVQTPLKPPKETRPHEEIVTLLSFPSRRNLLKAAKVAGAVTRVLSDITEIAQISGSKSTLNAHPGLRWLRGQRIEALDPYQAELDALQRALPKLRAIDRYERRALSRRRKAIQRFCALRDR